MDFITVGVSVLLVSHGVLVHGGVGLRGGVVRGRDAVTGLTAVVTVPVIHSAVWILICSQMKQHGVTRNNRGLNHVNYFCIAVLHLHIHYFSNMTRTALIPHWGNSVNSRPAATELHGV